MKPLVSDAAWTVVEPLLPPELPTPRGGRPRLCDRAVLNGIPYVLRTGTAWELLRPELGWGSGMTCRRRLRDWQHAGVWGRLHRVLLERLAGAGKIDWIVDRQGVPLAVRLTAANVHDTKVFDAVLDAVPALRSGRRGRAGLC